MRVLAGPAAPGVTILGIVRGVDSERGEVVRYLAQASPNVVALGLSPTEVSSIRERFVDVETEPLVPLYPGEAREVVALARLADVSLPSPAYVGALEWAKSRSVAVEGIEPDDDRYSEMFTTNVGYFELVRRTVRERRLGRRPPEASTPEEFALAWDDAITKRRRGGSGRLVAARESHAADRLTELRSTGRSVVAVVERERASGIATGLGIPDGSGSGLPR